MSEHFDRDLAALDEIEDLLAAYADARLSPSGPVLARMRAQVLREAVLRNAMAATRERAAASDMRRAGRFGIPRFRMPQRAFALGMAATLTLGTSAAVLAAPPGSPFYNARVALEAAFLPTQIDARLASHEMHIEERIAEAEAAAARGDVVALEAALVAYQSEVDAAVADIGEDTDRLAYLEAVLTRHVAKLEALGARLNNDTAADNAVEHAIAASEKAVKKLKDKAALPPDGRPLPRPAGSQGNSQSR